MGNILHYLLLAVPVGETIVEVIAIFMGPRPISGDTLNAAIAPTLSTITQTFHVPPVPPALISKVCEVVAEVCNDFSLKAQVTSANTNPLA